MRSRSCPFVSGDDYRCVSNCALFDELSGECTIRRFLSAACWLLDLRVYDETRVEPNRSLHDIRIIRDSICAALASAGIHHDDLDLFADRVMDGLKAIGLIQDSWARRQEEREIEQLGIEGGEPVE